jgi:hypothetical protein
VIEHPGDIDVRIHQDAALIPPPPVVREKLAANYREARLLRSLLRVSLAAAEERHREASATGAVPNAPMVPAKRG